jgi:anti-anti-sigma factor
MATLDEQTEVDGVRVLRISGSITQDGIETLEPQFAAALPDGARAVVDIEGVDLITTPGLALIIATTKRLRDTRGRVVFSAAKGGVRDLLKRCRLDEVLDLALDQAEAMEKAKS